MTDSGHNIQEKLEKLLSANGLLVMGGFHPTATDDVPAFASNERTKTALLLGNAGPGMWRAFQQSEFHAEHLENGALDALDRWTKSVVDEIAKQLSARAIFPFEGPPYYPIQKWSRRSGAVHNSPLGISVHPVYGLWHAYRAVLLFPTKIQTPPMFEAENP